LDRLTKLYEQYTHQIVKYLYFIGVCFLCANLYFSNQNEKGLFIHIAIFLSFIYVILTKSNNYRFIFLTVANVLFILEIFIYKISFYDYLPLIYLILFINAFMLANPLINLMYASLYLMTIYHLKDALPNELFIGNMVAIVLNSLIYTALALLVNKLNKDHEVIKEKELKYRTLFDFSGDIVYLFELMEDDMPGKILEVNESACRKFGYQKEELLQMNPLEFTAHDRISKVKEIQKRLVNKGNVSFEGKYISKAGLYIPSEITANVFMLDGKKVVLAIARDITERKRLEEKLHYLAYHDSLTGLPNRDLLKEHIRHLKKGSAVAFLFVDLDGFKGINDTFGHDCGDEIIKLAAEKLTNCIDSIGIVTRFGGDEFLLLLEDANLEAIQRIAMRIIEDFTIPFQIASEEATVSVSIGISFAVVGVSHIELAIKEADMAMYTAKENGKNNYHFYEGNSILAKIDL
jgi:diguanylate cyclase (GGDEF)-like protein/PAS domain S-box-containing protein